MFISITRKICACFILASLAAPTLAQDPLPSDEALRDAYPERKNYSPYAGRNFPTRVFWGETHLHTGMSMDAGAFGARLTPDSHAVTNLRHAGLLVGDTVDFDQTLETNTHHAEGSSRRVAHRRRAKLPVVAREQGGGHRISRARH